MIYIISVVTMICFILGGVLIAASPNIHSIMEIDFTRRVDYNAKIAGLQFGNILVRSGTLTPVSLPPPAVHPPYQQSKNLGWFTRKDMVAEANITCNITAYLEGGTNACLNVTIMHN